MTIVAAIHDPLAIFLADDFSDVVTPHHDGADGRTTRVGTVMRPRSREIVRRPGIAADLAAHVPAAPRAGAAGIVSVAAVMAAMMMVMRMGFRVR